MSVVDPLIRTALRPLGLGLRLGESALGGALSVVRIARGLIGDDAGPDADFAAMSVSPMPDAAPPPPPPPPHRAGPRPRPPWGDRDEAFAGGEPKRAPARGARPAPEPDLAEEAVEPEAPLRDSAAAEPVVAAPEPPTAEPDHVDEGPELVASFAEPGAEDGASAELQVEEPWEGYAEMTAAEVARRLSKSSVAEVAAVELYERNGKGRKGVLQAAERRLANRQG